MKGHEPIIKYRKHGLTPFMVTIKYDQKVEKPLWDGDKPLDRLSVGEPPVVYVERGESPSMNFVVGLNVLLETDTITPGSTLVAKRIVENNPNKLIYAAYSTEKKKSTFFAVWEKGKWEIVDGK